MTSAHGTNRRGTWLAVFLLTLGVVGRANATTITFDELPTQPADGVSLLGVTFHVSNPFGLPVVFNSQAQFPTPGNLVDYTGVFVQAPNLEGPAFLTVLTLDFSPAIAVLEFGWGNRTFSQTSPFGPGPGGVFLDLFDPSLAALNSFHVTAEPVPPLEFAEGLFSYTGEPVGRAVLRFQSDGPTPGAATATSFAVDNLTFEAAAVPEPGSLWLLGTGLACLAWRRRLRRGN